MTIYVYSSRCFNIAILSLLLFILQLSFRGRKKVSHSQLRPESPASLSFGLGLLIQKCALFIHFSLRSPPSARPPRSPLIRGFVGTVCSISDLLREIRVLPRPLILYCLLRFHRGQLCPTIMTKSGSLFGLGPRQPLETTMTTCISHCSTGPLTKSRSTWNLEALGHHRCGSY
jgi:hypothetical protein